MVVVTTGLGATVTITADGAPEGKAFDRWTSADGVIFAEVNSAVTTFTMPAKAVTVKAVYKEVTSRGGTGGNNIGGDDNGGGSGDDPTPVPPAKEEYTVKVSDDTGADDSSSVVEVKATISDGEAKVDEIKAEDVAKVVDSIKDDTKESSSIVIDLSGSKQDINAVELSTKTVENIAEASKDSEKVEGVTIKLTDAQVELDGTAINAVADQADGDKVKLCVEETGQKSLNSAQQETLKNYETVAYYSASIESNGNEIHDLKGGKAVLSVKIKVQKGRNPLFYNLYYIAKDGTMVRCISRVINDMLQGLLSHLSDYVIIYDESTKNETELGENWKNAGNEEDDLPGEPVYRLYNPNSGEHFYTLNVNERDKLIEAGWSDEGVAWYSSEDSAVPVYRLYNPNEGDHHFTLNADERGHLIEIGWIDEGIGWYSEKSETVPVYRLYNPNSGHHFFTADLTEARSCIKAGWSDEGIAWNVAGD